MKVVATHLFLLMDNEGTRSARLLSYSYEWRMNVVATHLFLLIENECSGYSFVPTNRE